MASRKKVAETATAIRPRDAVATKNAILEAACVAFTRHGYEMVGVREIAGAAGVSASLVNRYFGSKEALFAATMERAFDFTALLVGEKSSLGERVARYLVTKRIDRTQFDPMIALLRSAPNTDAAAILRKSVSEQAAKPLAALLGGPQASARAGLILALLAGFDLMRNVIRDDDLSSANEESLIGLLGSALQAFVDGDAKTA